MHPYTRPQNQSPWQPKYSPSHTTNNIQGHVNSEQSHNTFLRSDKTHLQTDTGLQLNTGNSWSSSTTGALDSQTSHQGAYMDENSLKIEPTSEDELEITGIELGSLANWESQQAGASESDKTGKLLTTVPL